MHNSACLSCEWPGCHIVCLPTVGLQPKPPKRPRSPPTQVVLLARYEQHERCGHGLAILLRILVPSPSQACAMARQDSPCLTSASLSLFSLPHLTIGPPRCPWRSWLTRLTHPAIIGSATLSVPHGLWGPTRARAILRFARLLAQQTRFFVALRLTKALASTGAVSSCKCPPPSTG